MGITLDSEYNRWSYKKKIFWNSEEEKAASANAKAINAIFSVVDANIYTLISTYESRKDAWNILQTSCEGTSKVKEAILEMLTSKFENLKKWGPKKQSWVKC